MINSKFSIATESTSKVHRSGNQEERYDPSTVEPRLTYGHLDNTVTSFNIVASLFRPGKKGHTFPYKGKKK